MESAHRDPNERQSRYFAMYMPGEYRLYKDIDDLHDWTRKGILHIARPAVAGNGDSKGDDEDDGFDRIEVSGGPGMPSRCTCLNGTL